jgi:hypothetical protein
MKKINKLITTRAFRVTESGKRQYCEASITSCSEKTIEINVKEWNQSILGSLHSTDGFIYSGEVSVKGTRYEASCKRYMRYPDALIFGHWSNGADLQEFCIHATYHELNLIDPEKPEGPFFSPAA